MGPPASASQRFRQRTPQAPPKSQRFVEGSRQSELKCKKNASQTRSPMLGSMWTSRKHVLNPLLGSFFPLPPKRCQRSSFEEACFVMV